MPSSHSVCGDFSEATFPDYGRCKPRRLKRDCRNHIPIVPGFGEEPPASGDCLDENAVVIFDADETPPNRTLASIFDEDCEAILDENGAPILSAIV